MALRRNLTRPSRTGWAMRLALAAVAAVVGYFSITFSLAQIAIGQDPALAYRLAPYDGRVTAAYATSLAGNDASPASRGRADQLAKLALRQDPTAVDAAATLGLNAELRGDNAAARRYFTYAQRLSRRNLRTQLWMIEDAVGRGDVAAALHQYDITLRVFPNLSEVLYPVLASATTDTAVRAELIKTLAGRPLWGESFVNFMAGGGPDPRSTATLFTELRRAGVSVPVSARAGVVNALIATGELDAAWSYYRTLRPGAERNQSRDPRFEGASEAPSQFDWVAINDVTGPTTAIQGGLFDFAAPASVGGPMLQQFQLLPPGTYRLAGHTRGIEQLPTARPYWVLRCQDGRELGRVEVPNSSTAGGDFAGMFSVPAGCPLQKLLLMGRPSDAVSGLSGQIDRVALMPAGR